MPRTTGRTLELLSLLQSRREWSGAELCSRLQVSGRTLRRDVDDLRGIGYGIDSVPGVGGGYRLGVGASIPPLVLSNDEAVAIAVGLRTAAGGSGSVHGIADAAARALAKLEQSLSAETRERIVTVESALLPLGGPDAVDPVDVDVITIVARCIRESLELRIDYRRHDGTVVRRTIEPHRIVHTGSRWYVVARDPDRDVWRTLRLDRLTPRLPLGAAFEPRRIPDDEVRDLTSRSIAVAPYAHRYRVRMHASARCVETLFGASVARVTAIDETTCELEAGAQSPTQFVMYVATSGIDFDILDGGDGMGGDGMGDDGLREAVVAAGRRLLRAAGTEPSS